MTLNLRTGRALLARPNSKIGEEMANKAKEKPPERPVRLPMIRVCGRWQKPGYKPDDEEVAAWEKRCKDRNWDRKTGKPKVAGSKEAVKKK